jgi:lactate racemase
MRAAVNFQDERLDLEVPDDRLVAEWHGPVGAASTDVCALILEALEDPRDYPPLRHAVIPGDRVVIAFDVEIPAPRPTLEAVGAILRGAGVDPGLITVLASRGDCADLADLIPEGIALAVHDPDDRTQLAYLASTSEGRRIYLNRHLTDADVVVPVGLLGYDSVVGYRGPWSLIFPGLSDQETARSFREKTTDALPDRARPWPTLTEASEVCWLLGSQFHLGLVAGVSGPIEVVAGLESTVRDQGAHAVDRAWAFRAETRAELVVFGIGRPGVPARIDDLAEGLATATRLVRRGGKIVALSRAKGAIGPALARLIQAGDPRLGPAPLRGHEADPDYPAAHQLARALAWADVYLLSALGQEAVEDLAMIALDRPEEARRLVAASGSCLLVSQAERVRAVVADEP